MTDKLTTFSYQKIISMNHVYLSGVSIELEQGWKRKKKNKEGGEKEKLDETTGQIISVAAITARC